MFVQLLSEHLVGANLSRTLSRLRVCSSSCPPRKTTHRCGWHFYMLILYTENARTNLRHMEMKTIKALCKGKTRKGSEMTIYGNDETDPFWLLLKKETGGLPGQEKWIRRNATQWTEILNTEGDRIGVYINNYKLLWLTITGSITDQKGDYKLRMKLFSQIIIYKMSDQQLAGEKKIIERMTEYEINKCIEKASDKGRSIRVQMEWIRDDQNGWPEAAHWIKQQFERLNAIANGRFG